MEEKVCLFRTLPDYDKILSVIENFAIVWHNSQYG